MIMKTLKYTLSALVAVLLCVCVVSCGEDYSSPLKGQTVSDQTFETGTNSKTVTIGTKDLSKCNVSSSANWCSATIQSSTVVITVQPNDTYEQRQAIITLTDPEDATTLSFNVIQNQNDAIITEVNEYEVPEEGGDLNINVKSNVSYQIITNVDWITLKSTSRGLESSSFVINVAKNNSGDIRKAIITVKDNHSGAKSDIVINQTLKPYINVDKTEIIMDEYGHSIDIIVNTNIKYEIEIQDNWLEYNGSKEEEDGIHEMFSAHALNNPNNERSTKVIIANLKWNIAKSISVCQKSILHFTTSSIDDLYVGDTFDVNKFLVNNSGQDVRWSSSNTSIVTVNDKGVIKGVKEGNAIITSKTEDGKYSADFAVKVINKPSQQESFINISKQIDIIEIGTGFYTGGASYMDFYIKNNSTHDIVIKNVKGLKYSGSGEIFYNRDEDILLTQGNKIEYEVVKEDNIVTNYFLDNSWMLYINYLNKTNNKYYTKKVKLIKSGWIDTHFRIEDFSDTSDPGR